MKRKLFLLLCALLTMIGVQAQVDVTDTYITNADFSSTTGWTKVSGGGTEHSEGNGLIGTYVVYGTAATADASHLSTEYCFGLNARWSGRYTSYQQTATLPAGNYLLTYDVENTNAGTTNATYNNLFYVQVGETKYDDTSTEWMMGKRGWTTHIISFSLASESDVTISLGYGTGSNNYGQANTPALYVSHLKLTYSASNALDYTSKITNHSFEDGDTNGWTHGSSSDTGVRDNSNNTYKTEGCDGSKLFNTWWQGVPITQEITEIPNGKYVIKASLAGSDDGANAKLFLLGPTASEHSNVIEIYKGTKGVFHDYAYEVLVTSKKITIGAVGGNDAGEYLPAGHWWYKADNFRLYYLGEDLSMYQVPLETAQAYAKGVDQESPMNASVLSALQAAITAYGDKEFSTFETSDDIIDAIDALNGSADNANASISNYQKADGIINAASVLDAAGQASYAANETVSAVKSAYDARTLEAVTSEQEAACHTALVAATKVQTTVGSDWTTAIENNSFETGDFTGWTNTDMATQNNTSFEKVGTYYAEAWQPNGTRSVKQTISAMPAGVYRLSAKSKARGVTSVKIFANGVDQAITIADATAEYSVEFACDDNADVEIGFEGIGTGAGSSWLCVDNFTLTLVSAGLPDVTPVVGKMNAEVAAAQTAAVEKYEANRTIANYNEASAAIAAAQVSKDAYASANVSAYLAKLQPVLDNTNVYTTETYNKWYANVQSNYDNGLYTNQEVVTLTENGAFSTGWHSTNRVDDILLSAWTIGGEQCKDYDKSLYINTWSVEGAEDGSEFLAPFFEYWVGDGNVLAANTIVATVEGLKANTTYSFTIRARVRQTDGQTKIANGVTMKVGNGEAVDISAGTKFQETSFYIGNFSAVGETDGDGKMTMTMTVAENSNISWLSFYNAKWTEGEDLSAYIADYEFALSSAKGCLNNAAYVAVTGKEKADLDNAIDTYDDGKVDETSKTALIGAKEALETASNTFVAAAPAYTALAELNSSVAAKLGVALPEITSETVAADLDVNGIVVAEYTAAKAYAQDLTAKLGEWTNAPGNNKGESWKDGDDEYYDLYNAADRAMTQTVTLPMGDYALIAKARASVNGRLTLVVGDETVTYAHKGSTGRGIATDGTATFDPEATYTNNNNGRGWEYRVMTFTSDGATPITLTFNWKTASNNWCGLDDIELRLDANSSANLKVNDGKLGTFIAPFDVTLPDNVKAYSATVENNEVKLSRIAEGGDKLNAGTPVVVFGDGVSVDETFYGDAAVTENKTVGNLVGILNESEKTVPVDAYVLQTQTIAEQQVQAFYKVTTAAPGALNRCYVIAASPKARLVISFDGEDPTAINAIEAAEAEDGALKDGKYLIDGKVILVKNGVKYSANGQILK